MQSDFDLRECKPGLTVLICQLLHAENKIIFLLAVGAQAQLGLAAETWPGKPPQSGQGWASIAIYTSVGGLACGLFQWLSPHLHHYRGAASSEPL